MLDRGCSYSVSSGVCAAGVLRRAGRPIIRLESGKLRGAKAVWLLELVERTNDLPRMEFADGGLLSCAGMVAARGWRNERVMQQMAGDALEYVMLLVGRGLKQPAD